MLDVILQCKLRPAPFHWVPEVMNLERENTRYGYENYTSQKFPLIFPYFFLRNNNSLYSEKNQVVTKIHVYVIESFR